MSAATEPVRSISQLLGLIPERSAQPVDVVRLRFPPHPLETHFLCVQPAIALKSSKVDPDGQSTLSAHSPAFLTRFGADYPPFAHSAKHFNTDIQSLYLDALTRQQAQDKVDDRYCQSTTPSARIPADSYEPVLERARDFVELNDQVEVCLSLYLPVHR